MTTPTRPLRTAVRILATILLVLAPQTRVSAQAGPQPASRRSEPAPYVPKKPERIIQPALQPAATTPPPLKKGFRLEAVYDEGFGIRAPDISTELKLGASTQLDARFYDRDSIAPNSFDIRRARIDFQAKLFKRLAIRIQAALEDGTPYIRNAFADLKLWNFLHLRGGQMKVPFSSSWLSFDNQVDFLERSADVPFYPFFDRGGLIWGSFLDDRITYTFGVFTGAGVDVDYPKGDYDDNKDIAWRLFLQPFRKLPLVDGLYLAGNGTYGIGSVAGKRFETKGLMASDFESQVWRWRADQTLGTNGRNSDALTAYYDARTRWGAEIHYINGPFTFSGEWVMVRYDNLRLFHDFMQGSKRLRHDPVFNTNGSLHNLTAFVSYFITGESKFLDTWGWRQPTPRRPLFYGGRKNGPGAFEVLARFSATIANKAVFQQTTVPGFAAASFTDPGNKLQGAAVGEGASVKASFLEGAPLLYETTIGLNWTMNYHLRLMLDYVYLYAADFAVDAKGNVSGGLLSGGNSDVWDATSKGKQEHSEHCVGMRFIIRI